MMNLRIYRRHIRIHIAIIQNQMENKEVSDFPVGFSAQLLVDHRTEFQTCSLAGHNNTPALTPDELVLAHLEEP